MTSSPLFSTSLVLLALGACTHHANTKNKDLKEPVAASAAAKTAPDAPKPKASPTVLATPAPTLPPETCMVLSKVSGEPPYFVAGKDVVLTRVFKTCVTRDGRRGVEKDTPWIAMGFPCTGGQGRIDIKGNYNNPKMVAFILGTDCSMNPQSKESVKKIVTDATGLPVEAKLMAYTPFVLQYWEIPGQEDADTGFSIELRSTGAVEGLWNKFKKQEPVHVRLWGRENAWGQGDNFYYVEADLRMAARTAFTLTVTQAKSVSKEELQTVKARCEALRPRRNCGEVF